MNPPWRIEVPAIYSLAQKFSGALVAAEEEEVAGHLTDEC